MEELMSMATLTSKNQRRQLPVTTLLNLSQRLK
jgi:hypothetical protein